MSDVPFHRRRDRHQPAWKEVHMAAQYGGTAAPQPKVTVPDILKAKRDGRKITMMTAYDTAFAKLVDASGIDIILVGDSLGMVVLGYPTTVPVTMDDMVRHAAAVSRGAHRPLLVGDMPFGSYQASSTDALHNAARFLKEAGMDAIKVEGGHEVVETVRALVDNGIAVMVHVGLTPQRVAQLGGFKVQAKTSRAARALIDDALALEDAGAFSIVLESVPSEVGQLASERLALTCVDRTKAPLNGQVETADIAVVATKSQGTAWAAETAKRILGKHGTVLTIQNGLGHRERLATVLGDERVAVGVIYVGAALDGDNLRTTGPGRVELGRAPHVDELAAALASGGMR